MSTIQNSIDHSGGPIRVMALHALEYCPRLFYLEEVEEIRLADDRVFAGRSLHEELRQTETKNGEWTSVELSSDRLGLVGKVDCLKHRNGSLIPYEHKRGRSHRNGKKAHAWPSDALQVSAYGMLLEEQFGQHVPEGRIRYHAENITVRVPLDDEQRANVLRCISCARELRKSQKRPPIAKNDRLCIRCSLAPVCLPEEERLTRNHHWEAVRMFPAEREQKTLHVTTPGAKVSRSGDQLKIVEPSGASRSFPAVDVGAIVLHGFAQMTTQALHFCVRQEVDIQWLSGGGYHVAGLAPGAGPVQRRLRQFQALSDLGTCLRLVRELTKAKVESALRYVMRSTRDIDRDKSGITPSIEIMRDSLRKISRAEGIASIRGHEGMAARAYFEVLPRLLRPEVPTEMYPFGRNRRPPRDRFNALLSFGYSLIYQNVLQAILSVGLEPALGFYHTPRSAAHPLVLDLMELFRLPVWDIPLIGSVNRLSWNCNEDFQITGNRVWLSDTGRKKAITLFEKRLTDKWRHTAIGYSLSYARLVELEVRLLEKEWTGSPGLFAQMRLR